MILLEEERPEVVVAADVLYDRCVVPDLVNVLEKALSFSTTTTTTTTTGERE